MLEWYLISSCTFHYRSNIHLRFFSEMTLWRNSTWLFNFCVYLFYFKISLYHYLILYVFPTDLKLPMNICFIAVDTLYFSFFLVVFFQFELEIINTFFQKLIVYKSDITVRLVNAIWKKKVTFINFAIFVISTLNSYIIIYFTIEDKNKLLLILMRI